MMATPVPRLSLPTRCARRFLLAGLVSLAIGGPGTYAQDRPSASTPALFEREAVLDLTLAMDLHAVTRDTRDDRPYHPATLSFLDDAGNPVSLDVGVKTRGHFRLHALNCAVPPLRLNVKKKQDLTFHQQQTDPALTTLMAVFQYMIGNTDWVCSQGHNVTFLYFDTFYTALDDPRTVRDAFLGTCLKP